MIQPEFDPFDPVSAAMGALHQGNLLAAKEAQISNLKAELTNCKSEADQLKAEVERLRKVGDAMAREIRTLSPIDDYSSGIIKAWNAAKEGKQS